MKYEVEVERTQTVLLTVEAEDKDSAEWEAEFQADAIPDDAWDPADYTTGYISEVK